MTIKLLFWIALIVLVVLAVRSKVRKVGGQDRNAAGPQNSLADGEAMTCCAHCHVYFPASEAVQADGRDYCSPGHVRLPPQ